MNIIKLWLDFRLNIFLNFLKIKGYEMDNTEIISLQLAEVELLEVKWHKKTFVLLNLYLGF